MKVIFKKDLPGQGQAGEIKEVKDGYGKNFLIKKGYAVLLTEKSLEILKREKEEESSLKEKELVEARELKQKLEKEIISFEVKTANEEEKIFGSISSKQICEELINKGYNIDKKMIKIDKPLSYLGSYKIKIELHKEVEAILKVELIKE